MVGLKTYEIKDESIYNSLKNSLSGVAFFRKDERGLFVKSPSLKIIKELIRLGSITELPDNSQVSN